MPHYDYYCSNCGHKQEIYQKMSEEALKDCPQCQQSTFHRRPGGGSGIIFRGSGFYGTDYPSSSKCCPCGDKSSCGH